MATSHGGTRQARTILLLTQTFPPDPAAVGQHFGDVARELAHRGHGVVVLTSERGYDDPAVRYRSREVTEDGVVIRRLSLASLGKASMGKRILASALFMLQCLWVGVRVPALGGVLFSTAPPLVGVVGALIGMLRRVPVGYWAMDLNPDQLIVLGKIRKQGIVARVLELLNRFVLARAALVVALDPLMADRLHHRGAHRGEIRVIPPWSPDKSLDHVPRHANEFRLRHGFGEALVVMYSGNHSPSNPLTTLLEAAVRLRAEPALRFVFVGGGTGKREVEQYVADHSLTNVVSLSYQPRESLSASLAAADVHVVSLGNRMAGIIHPSKVYGAMAVARPILYFGPSPSHVTQLIDEHDLGWSVPHGDVEGAVATIRRIAAMSEHERENVGARARAVLQRHLAAPTLCARFCDAIEEGLPLARSGREPAYPTATAPSLASS